MSVKTINRYVFLLSRGYDLVILCSLLFVYVILDANDMRLHAAVVCILTVIAVLFITMLFHFKLLYRCLEIWLYNQKIIRKKKRKN